MRNSPGVANIPVYTSTGEPGLLDFSVGKPRIKTRSNKIIRFNEEDEYFLAKTAVIVGNSGRSESISVDKETEVMLKPQMTLRKSYLIGMGQMPDSFWPPATEGWYGRIREGGTEVTITIQQLRNSQDYWITVSDMQTGMIYESHRINRYEIGVLELTEDWEIENSVLQFLQEEAEISREQTLQILDGPPPPWSKFLDLAKDVIIDNLKLGIDMRSTLSPLVPRSFPTEIREELMAFLAWITKGELPDKDPVDYFASLMPTPILRALIMGYLRCAIDQTDPPPYVRLMAMAERRRLELPGRPTAETIEKSPWLRFWDRVSVLTPNWYGRANDFVARLNQSDTIITGLPISRSAAKRSKKSWRDRFALLCAGVFLRAHVKPSSIGLHSLVYFGSAHRWPHNHMAWITRLGDLSENPPYLQVLQMPAQAAERTRRFFPGIMDVSWAAREVNHNLYDRKRGSWNLSLSRIIDSVSQTSSLRKLRRKYGKWFGKKTYQVNRVSAKILDIAARTIYLSNLEHKKQLSYWKLTTAKIRSVLMDLQQKEILKVIYEAQDPDLVSMLTIAQGDSDKICSLSSAFLEHTPTSLAMLGNDCGKAIILTKMPAEDIFRIQSLLPERCHQEGLSVRCLRPRALWSYTGSLYQRLLKADGTWDDNVSGFLSQARSMHRNLSEDNV